MSVTVQFVSTHFAMYPAIVFFRLDSASTSSAPPFTPPRSIWDMFACEHASIIKMLHSFFAASATAHAIWKARVDLPTPPLFIHMANESTSLGVTLRCCAIYPSFIMFSMRKLISAGVSFVVAWFGVLVGGLVVRRRVRRVVPDRLGVDARAVARDCERRRFLGVRSLSSDSSSLSLVRIEGVGLDAMRADVRLSGVGLAGLLCGGDAGICDSSLSSDMTRSSDGNETNAPEKAIFCALAGGITLSSIDSTARERLFLLECPELILLEREREREREREGERVKSDESLFVWRRDHAVCFIGTVR
eukprot:Opistho-2@70323